MGKSAALDLGDGNNTAYDIFYTDVTGECERVARVRDEQTAHQLFDQYAKELES